MSKEFPCRSENTATENGRSASEELKVMGQTVEFRMGSIVGLRNGLPGSVPRRRSRANEPTASWDHDIETYSQAACLVIKPLLKAWLRMDMYESQGESGCCGSIGERGGHVS